MRSENKKFWIGSAAAAAAAAGLGALSYSITKSMVDIALNRDRPKIASRSGRSISGSRKSPEISEAIRTAQENLENLPSETVSIISSRDRLCLKGHLIRAEKPRRILIAMHGWRSSWARDFGCIADFWLKNGCTVLFAEQRGQGSSGGDYMGFGLLERYDCLDWIHWVSENLGTALPVYLAGVSMGASTVLMTAGFSLPDNVKGIMADCGFTDPHAIWKHVSEDNLHLHYGLRGNVADGLCRKKIHVDSRSYSTLRAMKQCRVPVLFVHGTDDTFVPVEMTYENYKACAAPKRLLIVPGAGHALSWLTDRERYEKAVQDFWAEFDA